MKIVGLPGETAITIVVAFTNNIYAALGTMAAFNLTFRQITILAVIIGLAHTLFVETGVLIKLRMANVGIALFRITVAFITGFLMNLLLPQNISGAVLNPYIKIKEFSWLNIIKSINATSIQIIIFMFIIMLIYELIMLWKYSGAIKKRLQFIPNSIGLSSDAFGPWLVGFFIGITYGAGILSEFSEKQKLSHKDICMTTIFLCLAHAIVEDTMVFVVIGGNILYILFIRIFMAFIVVRIISINGLYKKFLWVGLPKEK